MSIKQWEEALYSAATAGSHCVRDTWAKVPTDIRAVACCGSTTGVEEHHLYLRADGCSDDLTVWLCHVCHGRARGMNQRINISQRTRDALAIRKAQGKKLGGTRAKSIQTHEEAKARAEALRPLLAELAGMSANALAVELNKRGVPTPNGGAWHAGSVIRVQRRLAD